MRVYDIWTGEPHKIKVSKWLNDASTSYAVYFDGGQISGVYTKSEAEDRMKEYIKANGLSCIKPLFRSRCWKGYRREYKK